MKHDEHVVQYWFKHRMIGKTVTGLKSSQWTSVSNPQLEEKFQGPWDPGTHQSRQESSVAIWGPPKKERVYVLGAKTPSSRAFKWVLRQFRPIVETIGYRFCRDGKSSKIVDPNCFQAPVQRWEAVVKV